MKDPKRKRNIRKINIKIITSIIIFLLLIFLLNTKNKEEDTEKIEVVQVKQVIENETQKQASILTYYKGYPAIAKLEIPKINLETYVLSEYSKETLNISVTKYFGCNPNEIGNFCISGHNFVTQNMFHNLKDLEINDLIKITDGDNRIIEYKIYNIFEVTPKETDCLSQKTGGKKEVTLITCTSDSKNRIIVKASEII